MILHGSPRQLFSANTPASIYRATFIGFVNNSATEPQRLCRRHFPARRIACGPGSAVRSALASPRR
ncbi:hypothetical protein BSLA_02r1700 [Burkholderia stabilis]|nr:hypothetical protein BSLA_02r1700 [Burkholderia stabilis]